MDNQELIELIITVIKREISPINVRLDSIDNRLEVLDNRLEVLDNRLKVLDNRLEILDNCLEVLDNRLGVLEIKEDNLVLSMKGMERDIKKDIRLLKEGQETLITVMKAKGILSSVELQ